MIHSMKQKNYTIINLKIFREDLWELRNMNFITLPSAESNFDFSYEKWSQTSALTKKSDEKRFGM